jgi:hypothetical protein
MDKMFNDEGYTAVGGEWDDTYTRQPGLSIDLQQESRFGFSLVIWRTLPILHATVKPWIDVVFCRIRRSCRFAKLSR